MGEVTRPQPGKPPPGSRCSAVDAQAVVRGSNRNGLGELAPSKRQHPLARHIRQRLHHFPVLLHAVHASVSASDRQPIPAGVKGAAGCGVGVVRCQGLEVLELAEVPELHAVRRACRQVVAVLREAEGGDWPRVGVERCHVLGGPHLPDPHSVVGASGPEDQPVWVKASAGVRRRHVGIRHLQHAVGRVDVIERPRRIGGGADEELPGGVQGQALDILAVLLAYVHALKALVPALPHAHCAVRRGRDERVWAADKRDVVHALGVPRELANHLTLVPVKHLNRPIVAGRREQLRASHKRTYRNVVDAALGGLVEGVARGQGQGLDVVLPGGALRYRPLLAAL
mmetsp:Transcript_20923/g.49921  ORF Transcript_20923/g.49921 Transcript_20923/m.49921 type:complete len:341 (-) Transcript_20923:415-1437(-)